MHFGLSRPQELLQRSLRDLLERECPIERVREIGPLTGAERTDATGDLLRSLADQGALGILAPEAQGGVGGSLLDAAVVAQELGRAVAPVSLHEGWVLGVLLLTESDDDDARARLTSLIEGDRELGVSIGDLANDGERLDGEAVTSAGPGAELLAVVGEGGDQRGLLLAPASLEHSPIDSIDLSRPLWTVRCTTPAGNARIDRDAASSRRALDAARIVLAADLFGAAQRALEIAVAYSLERRQFGRVVGSYQAVKHVCAERAAALEPVQSMLWQTAHAWDEQEADAEWMAPLLKAHAAEVAMETVTQATQVFGGMGFTWECDAHLYYKRVAQSRQLLGGPAELRAEAARMRYGEIGADNG